MRMDSRQEGWPSTIPGRRRRTAGAGSARALLGPRRRVDAILRCQMLCERGEIGVLDTPDGNRLLGKRVDPVIARHDSPRNRGTRERRGRRAASPRRSARQSRRCSMDGRSNVSFCSENLLEAEARLGRQGVRGIVARDDRNRVLGTSDSDRAAEAADISKVAFPIGFADPHREALHGEKIGRRRNQDPQADRPVRRETSGKETWPVAVSTAEKALHAVVEPFRWASRTPRRSIRRRFERKFYPARRRHRRPAWPVDGSASGSSPNLRRSKSR